MEGTKMLTQEEILIANKTRKPTQIITPSGKSILQDKSLSLFQKILLTTDGTVTNLLALYTGETIKVKKVRQEMIFLNSEQEACADCTEIPILKRSTLLSGRTENYIYTESEFIFEHLSRDTQYKLLETDQPIGLAWREEKLESYREIIEYKMEPCETISHYFDVLPQTPILSRTYLIYHNQNTLGMITEKFPITHFK